MRLDGLVDLVEQISCHPSGKVSRVVIIPGSTRKFHRITVIISAQGVDNILQHRDTLIQSASPPGVPSGDGSSPFAEDLNGDNVLCRSSFSANRIILLFEIRLSAG